MTEPPLYPIQRAEPVARDLVVLLAPACRRITVAGSIRRGAHWVHDIDLVAWAKYDDATIPNLFGERAVIKCGPDALVGAIRRLMIPLPEPEIEARILRFTWQSLPVEIYLAERDGANYDALLQMRTGSERHNKWLARTAHARGLDYHAGHGIYAGQARIDDGTERGLYDALGIPFIKPENRY